MKLASADPMGFTGASGNDGIPRQNRQHHRRNQVRLAEAAGVNYYAFHIGDYASATQHLTDLEDLAYRRMMDVYYVAERPLPLDRRQLYRLLRANSQDMRDAVDVVIAEFFTETQDGWRHGRCDAEIEKARAKSDKAKANGKLGGVANAKRTLDGDVADATNEASKGLAPKPKPNPIRIDEVVTRARDPDADLERKLRQAAGWQSDPSPKLAITGPIQALIDAGADLEQDVLPVVTAIAPRADGRSWNYFIKAIARARDQRISAATVVSMSTATERPSHAANRQKPTRDETFAAIDRRIAELAEAERGTAGGGEDGAGGLDEGAA
jgi:uncharacterized protein YdaU (DUF1376 family)